MTENQFAKLSSWLKIHYLKKNSISIVLQETPEDSSDQRAWKIDKFLGNEIKLRDPIYFLKNRKERHRTITKDTFDRAETLLDKIYISLSKENIMKEFKEHKV